MDTYQNNFFFTSEEIPWEDMGGGVSRQIMGYNKELMMVKVKFEKGAVGSLHQHYHSQTSYVAEGAFELTIGDRKKKLQTGDSFFIEPDIPHSATCLEKGVLIDIFSPVREDFLDGSKVNYFGRTREEA